MDLDKKWLNFVQMWGKNYGFGRKSDFSLHLR